MDEDMRLSIEIKNNRPVDVRDLARFMMGLSDEYHSLLIRETDIPPDNVSLRIKEVKSGSIIAELVPYATTGLLFAATVNTIISFCKHLDIAFLWLSGKSDDEIAAPDREMLQNLSEIVDMTAKDRGASININVVNNNGVIVMPGATVTSTDANAIQNEVRRQIADLKQPVTGEHKGVLLHWDQAKNQSSNTKSDKAIIESISGKSVKVIFEDDKLKNRMLFDIEYPFKKAFLVDVSVDTVNEKPALYKVKSLHEVINLENGQES